MAVRDNFAVLASSGIAALDGSGDLAVFRELPLQVDTNGYVWQLKYAPSPAYVWPILNGVTLDPYSPDGDPQFTLDGKILTLAEPVNLEGTSLGNDWFWVWYFRKGAKGTGTGSGKARQFGAGPLGGPGTAVALGRRIDWLEARVQINLITPPAVDDTITIGAVTYVFAASITSIYNAVPNIIALGGNVIQNLDAAINAVPGGGGVGGGYSAATTPNPDVMSAGYGQLKAKAGSTLDSITLTSTAGGKITFSLPSAYLTFVNSTNMTSGIMHDGDTVTIGSRTYTFKNAINNANPYEILNSTSGDPGLDLDTPVRRLVDAINGGFGSGTRYSSATTANPDVTASYDRDSENMALQSKVGGAVTVALSTSSGGRFFWSDPALSGGSGASTDILDWGSNDTFRITGDLGIGIWLKIGSDVADGTYVAIEQGSDGGGGSGFNDLYTVAITKSGSSFTVTWRHEHGSQAVVDNAFSNEFQTDRWQYIGFTRDATAKTVKLYSNLGGATVVLIDTWTYSTNADGGADAGTRLTVGNTQPANSHCLNGAVQEHYIWSCVVTLDQHQNASEGNPSLTHLVLGCFMGDDPEVDFSATGSDGAVTGTTLVQGHN